MRRVTSFVALPDMHTQGGNLKHLPAIVDRVNALRLPPRFAISLGDCVYGLPENDVAAEVRQYHEAIARLRCAHYYVIGNHEIKPIEVFGNLTWEALLATWGMPGRWYSFSVEGWPALVLDSWLGLQLPQYAELLQAQCVWLAGELAKAQRPVLIFTHEALGFEQSEHPEWVATDNRRFWPTDNPLAQLLLTHSDRVAGVFEGHKHKSLHKHLGGISWHLLGASFLHDGQFAQVFMREDGAYFVQAHPEGLEQTAGSTVQETYGDPAVRAEYVEALQSGDC